MGGIKLLVIRLSAIQRKSYSFKVRIKDHQAFYLAFE
jgi:hypothetical protein